MNLKDNGEPDTGLNFTRRMPLFGQLFDEDVCDLEMEAQRMRNKRVFQLLLLYDEYPIERRNEEGGKHTSELDGACYRF